MFDWLVFFKRYRIEYVDSGQNVAHGNVNIKCPFCASADPSHHLGISLSGEGWGCWRNQNHRGVSPVRLIQVLLRCSQQRAYEIAGKRQSQPEGFMTEVNKLFKDHDNLLVKQTPPLAMPKEFKTFSNLPSARIFLRYMQSRGFDHDVVLTLGARYGLRYCTMGPFRGRVIFPIHFQRCLVNWTGRDIFGTGLIRYRTLSFDVQQSTQNGLPSAVRRIDHCLLWYDDILKADADTIYLVEGPFDSLKLSVLGDNEGIVSTCFFTSAPSQTQIDLLHELLPRFKHKYLLLDQDTWSQAIDTVGHLAALGVRLCHLPKGVKDPGDLTLETWGKLRAM